MDKVLERRKEIQRFSKELSNLVVEYCNPSRMSFKAMRVCDEATQQVA